METTVTLTTLGREYLEKAGMPTDFKAWLELVRKETGRYARKSEYQRHFENGRVPKEAIQLVAADRAAETICQEVARRCNEEFDKLDLKQYRYGSAYIAERVVYLLEQRI